MKSKQISFRDCLQNRELSWLKFNERVLQEANRLETPLLERLKFISIFTKNLDEFYMVRVGSLTDIMLIDAGFRENKTGMTAQEQLKEIFLATKPLYAFREKVFFAVMKRLARNNVKLLKMQDLDLDKIKSLKKYFILNVMPLLSPQIIDLRHPFPHLDNKQLHIAVAVEKKKELLYGLIAMPAGLNRLVFLDRSGYRFILLEDLIFYFADLAFGSYKVVEKNIIAVTRNSDINMEDNTFD